MLVLRIIRKSVKQLPFVVAKHFSLFQILFVHEGITLRKTNVDVAPSVSDFLRVGLRNARRAFRALPNLWNGSIEDIRADMHFHFILLS